MANMELLNRAFDIGRPPSWLAARFFVASTDQKLYAFNEATGAVLFWPMITGGPIFASPAASGGISLHSF